MNHRIICLLLCLCMVLGVVPMSRAAGEPELVLEAADFDIRSQSVPAAPEAAQPMAVNSASYRFYATSLDLSAQVDTKVTVRFTATVPAVLNQSCAIELWRSGKPVVGYYDLFDKQTGTLDMSFSFDLKNLKLTAGTYDVYVVTYDSANPNTGHRVDSTLIHTTLTVQSAAVGLQGLVWKPDVIHMTKGDQEEGGYVVCSPASATVERSVSYSSSNTNLATVQNKGDYVWITAKEYGTVSVIAAMGGKSASVRVEICTDDAGHTLRTYQKPIPNCTSSGYTIVECTKCGYVDSKIYVPAIGHNYQYTSTQEATCTEQGFDLYTCLNCGGTTKTILPALGHDWTEPTIVVEEVGDEWGVKHHICKRCSFEEDYDYHTCPAEAFTDCVSDTNWAHRGIDYCLKRGIMSGNGNGMFYPAKSLTRAELVSILYRLAGSPETEFEAPFIDLTKDWYKDAVNWAAENGIVSGTSATTFSPNLAVSREVFATVLYQYYTRYLHKLVNEPGDLSRFADADRVHSYAAEGMAWAVQEKLIAGITSGDSLNLAPRTVATRAQAARILMMFCGLDLTPENFEEPEPTEPEPTEPEPSEPVEPSEPEPSEPVEP